MFTTTTPVAVLQMEQNHAPNARDVDSNKVVARSHGWNHNGDGRRGVVGDSCLGVPDVHRWLGREARAGNDD